MEYKNLKKNVGVVFDIENYKFYSYDHFEPRPRIKRDEWVFAVRVLNKSFTY